MKTEELKLKLINAYVFDIKISNKDFCDTLEQYAGEEFDRGYDYAIDVFKPK